MIRAHGSVSILANMSYRNSESEDVSHFSVLFAPSPDSQSYAWFHPELNCNLQIDYSVFHSCSLPVFPGSVALAMEVTCLLQSMGM